MGIFSLGEVEIDVITEVVDLRLPVKRLLAVSDLKFDKLARLVGPAYVDMATNELRLSIHSYLVRTPEHVVLVDPGYGKDKMRGVGHYATMLRSPWLSCLSAKVPLDEIDYVICTHLHCDHVGWNTVWADGEWMPTFPRARYLFPRLDVEHFALLPSASPGMNGCYLDSVAPIIERGRADFVGDGFSVDRWVHLRSAAGHSPGHIVIELSSEGRVALLVGDLLHHPIQASDISVNSVIDVDHGAARTSRRAVFEFAADRGAVIFPAHFRRPYGLVVERGKNGFECRWLSATELA